MCLLDTAHAVRYIHMSDTQEIKDKLDIVDFIAEYVQLKPAGVNHKGLCPFHNEKSPSFMVNRERQSWHCFGCSKGGDIFSFLQEIEGMDFVGALRFLADRAGVTLTMRGSKESQDEKERLRIINEAAASFFHQFLTQLDQAKPALKYLHDRGLTKGTIEAWKIGYVPEQWDLLTQYLLKKGHGIDDLVSAGLTIKRDGSDVGSGRGYYDRFRGRIMFPIWDVHDRVVGFTGRTLFEHEKSGGKYVNTPQTPLFDKSKIVYGLNKAKQDIKKNDFAVMVEGQMDVIAVWQSGMENVVATSGTAMTEQHVTLLKRYSSNMRIAFDADMAGENAAKRGIDVARKGGVHVKVITIPDGKGDDPADCIGLDPAVWVSVVGEAQDIMEWFLDRAFLRYGGNDPISKQKIADELLLEIARIPFAVERDHWIATLSDKLGVSAQALRDDMMRLSKETKTQVQARQTKTKTEKKATSRFDMLLHRFLCILLFRPVLAENEFFTLHLPEIGSPEMSLYESMRLMYTKMSSLDVAQLRASSENGGENHVDVLLMKGERDFLHYTDSQLKKELEDITTRIRNGISAHRRATLTRHIQAAEKEGDSQKLQELLKQFSKLA